MDANSFKKPINERVKLAFFLLRAFAGCLEAAFLVGTGEENLKLNISFLRPAGPVKGIGNRWAGIYIVGVAKRVYNDIRQRRPWTSQGRGSFHGVSGAGDSGEGKIPVNARSLQRTHP